MAVVSTLAGAAPAMAAGDMTVSTTHLGPLQIGTSRTNAVRALWGTPSEVDPFQGDWGSYMNWLYVKHGFTPGLGESFLEASFFNGVLAAVNAYDPPARIPYFKRYVDAAGTRIGMSFREARRREGASTFVYRHCGPGFAHFSHGNELFVSTGGRNRSVDGFAVYGSNIPASLIKQPVC